MSALSRSRILVFVALAVMTAACHGSAAEPQTMPFSASMIIPNESLQDWVTYADQISVVTVLDEREVTPAPGVLERGEGYLGRRVTLRIDQTVWVAPGAQASQGEISMVTLGWALTEGRKIPFEGYLKVGETYLLPTARIDGRVTDISSGSSFRVVDGRVDALKSGRGWMQSKNGTSVVDVQVQLAATPPDPRAAQFAHLEGGDRARAVRAAMLAGP